MSVRTEFILSAVKTLSNFFAFLKFLLIVCSDYSLFLKNKNLLSGDFNDERRFTNQFEFLSEFIVSLVVTFSSVV